MNAYNVLCNEWKKCQARRRRGNADRLLTQAMGAVARYAKHNKQLSFEGFSNLLHDPYFHFEVDRLGAKGLKRLNDYFSFEIEGAND